jgi:hypothetical protein
MSECPIHRVELLLGRCWMCRGVPPGAASRSEQSAVCPGCGSPSWRVRWTVREDSNAPPTDCANAWHAGPAAQSPQVGAARVHELKCWPVYFQDVRSGRKNFEVRENDRGFRVGDVLRLREWDPSRGYSGEEERRVVTYILESGLFVAEGYVVLALAEPGRSTSDRPPVNPPVASADPELAALLREARNAIDELHGMYAYADLLARIDSALSRLAGQSATANASGGAARGSPEEER